MSVLRSIVTSAHVMRTYLTTAALMFALATPSTVMAFGAPCDKARVMEDACCSGASDARDETVTSDHNARIERACCCEISDAPGAASSDVSAVLDSSEPAPSDVTSCRATPAAPTAQGAVASVHPEARGPPALNSLLSQHVALLI